MSDQLPVPVDKIDPEAKQAFDAEMKRRKIDLSEYDLRYLATDDQFTVMTCYKKKPPGLRGSLPEFPDYEVVISRDEYKVLRVSIAR